MDLLNERVALLKALADPSRLILVNALLLKPSCVEELAERLRRAPSTISFHLKKLEEARLVTKSKAQYYQLYELRPDLLAMSLKDLVTLPAGDDAAEQKREQRYRKQVLAAFFSSGVLQQLPKKWRKRRVVLEQFLSRFEPGRAYPEHEVNDRIRPVFSDYCTIRRLLVDEGYLTRDGQIYRLEPLAAEAAAPSESEPPRKPEEKPPMAPTNQAELKRSYKLTPVRAGLFQIRNTRTGMLLLVSARNLRGPFNKHRFLLSAGMHPNAALQKDWSQQGPETFAFEILEAFERKDNDPAFHLADELDLLEAAWLEKLTGSGTPLYNEERAILRD